MENRLQSSVFYLTRPRIDPASTSLSPAPNAKVLVPSHVGWGRAIMSGTLSPTLRLESGIPNTCPPSHRVRKGQCALF
jgi:hypothetical protein